MKRRLIVNITMMPMIIYVGTIKCDKAYHEIHASMFIQCKSASHTKYFDLVSLTLADYRFH
jgi:hypothetical protein